MLDMYYNKPKIKYYYRHKGRVGIMNIHNIFFLDKNKKS